MKLNSTSYFQEIERSKSKNCDSSYTFNLIIQRGAQDHKQQSQLTKRKRQLQF